MSTLGIDAEAAGEAGETRFTAQAFGKVNPYLGAGPARADGFHELATIFQSVSLHDTVEAIAGSAEPGESAGDPRNPNVELEVRGLDAESVPTDRSNLVVRAVEAVARAYERACPGAYRSFPRLRLQLTKGIPTAGGMAGGSADAAAALRIAEQALRPGAQEPTRSAQQTGLPQEPPVAEGLPGRAELGPECGDPGRPGLTERELLGLAADLGSDVPFALFGGTALGRGRGERLERLSAAGTFHWVFAVAHEGLATPAVFRELDRLRAAGELPEATDPAGGASAISEALAQGNPRLLARALHNDLEPAAFSLRPELARLKAKGQEFGGLGAVLSGSGPTMAFLCADAGAADAVVRRLDAEPAVRLALSATAPAGGAGVVKHTGC